MHTPGQRDQLRRTEDAMYHATREELRRLTAARRAYQDAVDTDADDAALAVLLADVERLEREYDRARDLAWNALPATA